MIRLTATAVAAIAACGALLGACSREVEPAADRNTDMAVPAKEMAGGDVITVNPTDTMQSVSFVGGDGSALGSVALSEGAGGLTMAVSGTGMPAGTHGIHLHEKGFCNGPKFKSAGAHWNPARKQHGRDNPRGAHLGDLANLEVGASGNASASFTIPGAAMRGGATPVADADGTAIVVHAAADDHKTDPSGDSGDRIACAVIATPR